MNCVESLERQDKKYWRDQFFLKKCKSKKGIKNSNQSNWLHCFLSENKLRWLCKGNTERSEGVGGGSIYWLVILCSRFFYYKKANYSMQGGSYLIV
jgi:hypothetical protein